MTESNANARRLLWVLLLWMNEHKDIYKEYKAPSKKEIAEFTGFKPWKMGKNVQELIDRNYPPDEWWIKHAVAADRKLEEIAREERAAARARIADWEGELEIEEVEVHGMNGIRSAWYKELRREDNSVFYEIRIATRLKGYRYGFSATEMGARRMLDDMWKRKTIKTCGMSKAQAEEATKETEIINNQL